MRSLANMNKTARRAYVFISKRIDQHILILLLWKQIVSSNFFENHSMYSQFLGYPKN